MEAVALATQNGDEQGQDNGEEEGVEEVAATVADVDIAEETVGADANMPTGWYMASADWKPTPFGCLDGKIPNLVV